MFSINYYIVHHEIVTIATSHEYSSENDTIEYLFEHGYIELPFYTEILLYLGQTFQTHGTTHIVVSSIFVSNNLHGFSKPPVSKI